MNTASQCVVVVGMHRSGTSILTHVLSLLGADLPRRLMKAHESNPFGHFEPEVIVALHDQMLAAAGSSWFDWRKLPEEWFRSAECAQFKQQLIAAFHDDFGDSPFSVLKDPRLCRFLPLWESIFDQVNRQRYYVLPYRNPIEVVRSLAHRNGIEPYKGYVLWLRHLLDAEFATRHQPRGFLRYEDLLADPRPTIERLVAGSPIPWPRDVAQAFPEIELAIRPHLRHNQASIDGLANRAEVPALVQQTYECYQSLQMDPANKATWCKLDKIRTCFNVAADPAAATREAKIMVGTNSERQRGRDDKLQSLNFRLREALASSPSELKILPADSEVSAANVARLNHQLRQKSARIGYLYAILNYNAATLKKSDADAAALRRDPSENSAEIEKLNAALTNATAEIKAVRKSLSASSEESDNLRRALSQSEADAAALRADLKERSVEIERLRTELANWPSTLANVTNEIEAVRRLFLNSLSWRVTAPLRWLKQRLVHSSHPGHPRGPSSSGL